jgi:hypothetical protein
MKNTKDKRYRGHAPSLDKILSADEISQILSFLKHDDAFNFALSCKNNLESVTAIARNSNPVTTTEPWSLYEALKLRRCITLQSSSDAVDLLMAITKRNVTLSKLSTNMHLKLKNVTDTGRKEDVNIDNLFDILTLATGGTIVLPSRTKHDKMLVTREFPVVVGHELTELKNKQIWLEPTDVLYILSCTPNLRSFESIVVSDRYANHCINRDSCAYHNCEASGPIALPLFVELHTLCISSEDCVFPESDLVMLLQLTPNLTELHYTYDSYDLLTDDFLNVLVKNTPKLKSLKLDSDEEDELSPCAFTDKAFVQFFKMCKIEKLDIIYQVQDNNWMSNIGQHGQALKSLELHGANDDGYQIPVRFGGGVVSSLEKLVLDRGWAEADEEFYKSVLTTFPNIKTLEIGNMDISIDPYLSTILVHGLELKSVQLDLINENSREDLFVLQRSILQKKNLQKIALGIESECFDKEILKSHVCESVTSYRGPLHNSQNYLEAFWRTFPNLRVLKVFNRMAEPINKEFFNDRVHWPQLEEFTYSSAQGSFTIEGINHAKRW